MKIEKTTVDRAKESIQGIGTEIHCIEDYKNARKKMGSWINICSHRKTSIEDLNNVIELANLKLSDMRHYAFEFWFSDSYKELCKKMRNFKQKSD